MDHVSADQHVVALPDVDAGVERRAGHHVPGHHAVPRDDGKEPVDQIVLGPVVDDREPVDAGEVHAVDGESADGESAQREAAQRLPVEATGRVLVVRLGRRPCRIRGARPDPVRLRARILQDHRVSGPRETHQLDPALGDRQRVELVRRAFAVRAGLHLDAVACGGAGERGADRLARAHHESPGGSGKRGEQDRGGEQRTHGFPLREGARVPRRSEWTSRTASSRKSSVLPAPYSTSPPR